MKLAKNIWKQEKIPREWEIALIVNIQKKAKMSVKIIEE
jgi:hypothetical protein